MHVPQCDTMSPFSRVCSVTSDCPCDTMLRNVPFSGFVSGTSFKSGKRRAESGDLARRLVGSINSNNWFILFALFQIPVAGSGSGPSFRPGLESSRTSDGRKLDQTPTLQFSGFRFGILSSLDPGPSSLVLLTSSLTPRNYPNDYEQPLKKNREIGNFLQNNSPARRGIRT